MRAILAALLLCILILPATAHDSWISQQGIRNSAGEWCCGEHDCFIVENVQHVSQPSPGYRLPWGEFVAESETQPSPDGAYWRCRRPDGSMRCFFAPPENN